jgi:tetratricopeptide (TPR) repeat protein
MKLKRQRLISDGALSRMMQTASELWKLCDFEQCAEVMERASRLDPANSNLLLDLGSVYGKTHAYAAAEQSFEKAVRIAPAKTAILSNAGLRCLDFQKHEMAERFLKRAIEQKDTSPENFVKLAEIYERRHRLEEAGQFIERALKTDANCGTALLARARLYRQSGRFADAEQILRSISTTPDRNVQVRSRYELGGILDQQGRYDEAMAAFVEAKALLKPYAAPHAADLKVVRERLRLMKTGVSAEMFARWSKSIEDLKPPRRLALLGGHPRSGTTLLEQMLDSHPDIISAEETEIFHNAAYMPLCRALPENASVLSILESAGNDALRKSRANYFRSMELFLGNPLGDRLLIDKNPSLTFLIPAMVRIFPEIKIIIALRDPRDVCLSCFMQPLSLSQVSSAYLSLQDTIEEYVSLMSIWTTIAPLLKNSYIEVRYEDMVENLESVARRTLEFLEIPWNADVLRFDEHVKKKLVRSPTYADVAKPVFKTAVARWRNYQKYLEPYLETLEPFINAFRYEA